LVPINKNIYLSATLFTAAEVELSRKLAEKLRAEGYEVFLPQKIGPRGDQYHIFRSNVRAVSEADLVLAVTDGADVDSDVAWEMGFAYALQITVIAFRTDTKVRAGMLPQLPAGSPLDLLKGASNPVGSEVGKIRVAHVRFRCIHTIWGTRLKKATPRTGNSVGVLPQVCDAHRSVQG
jgi:hypothetical protein